MFPHRPGLGTSVAVKTLARALIVVVAMATPLVPAIPQATAAPTWAPAATAPIHPGVQTVTAGAQCTANFVFTSGTTVYIGQAAHCSGTGGQTETDGCTSGSLPIGTPVDVGGVATGTLVYNSWLTMQSLGEADANTCAYNDLALVQLSPGDAAKVNPSIPFWGGPTSVGGGTALGDNVYSYGNSSLRLGLTQLSPKNGLVVERTPGGWSYSVYTLTPGIPGDSGSAFLNANGAALGTLSTVAIAPLPASNGVGDVGSELAYARAHGFDGLELVNGTEPFAKKLLGKVPLP